MSPFRRAISIVAACAAVVAGTLLLTGNLQRTGSRALELEQSRVDALARLWETRFESARSAFRDQVLRHDLLTVLIHPEEWSPWRVQNKLDAIRSTWAKDNGAPRGFAVLSPDGRPHTAFADTSGLAEALQMMRRPDNVDAVLLARSGTRPETFALQFAPPSPDPSYRPGKVVALLDAATLLTPGSNTPPGWLLLADPEHVILASSGATPSMRVSETMWTLMVSQRAGNVSKTQLGTVCFARVQIPGMSPLLLILPVNASAIPAVAAGAFFVLAGLGVLFYALRKPVTGATVAEAVPSPPATEPAADSGGYRQIVQSITDPICVVDSAGAVMRANRAAQEWLRISHSRPDEALVLQTADGECNARELFVRAGSDPSRVCGSFRWLSDGNSLGGTVEAARLYRDDSGHGPVLLHFRFLPQQETRPAAVDETPPLTLSVMETVPDPLSPFPTLAITPDGLINAYNEAARRTCPRLEDTPLLSDVLPGLDGLHLPDLLERGHGSSFESLFGSRTHEFTVIFDGDHVLLYGRPAAESQNLEIEMKQAQENFYSLCALIPSPVLLVDPREHTVIEANAAAGDLFATPAAGLRGQTLDALAAVPWEPAAGNDLFIAASLSGARIPCVIRYELIKIEGMPALLVVLDPQAHAAVEAIAPLPPEVAREDVEAAPAAPPPLPPGPGLLITLDPTVRNVARRLLDKSGHACEAFSNLDDAVVWLITHDVRPEFLAIDLTDFDCVENWISDLRLRCGDVPCLAFTDGETYPLPGDGPNTFVTKPFDLDALLEALNAINVKSAACATA